MPTVTIPSPGKTEPRDCSVPRGADSRKPRPKTKPKSKAKATTTQQQDVQNGEDTQDDEDPLSLMDDNGSKQASSTKTLGESDGNRNATRTTAYEGPTSQEMLKALEESIADAATDTGTGTNGPAQHGEDMESGNADDNTTTASTRPPHRASTPVSDTDADDNHADENEPSTRRGGRRSQMTTSRPTPSPEPAAPPTSSPPESERILTYPNGPNMPPLITYKNATPPPPRRRSPSPARFPPPSMDPFLNSYYQTPPPPPLPPRGPVSWSNRQHNRNHPAHAAAAHLKHGSPRLQETPSTGTAPPRHPVPPTPPPACPLPQPPPPCRPVAWCHRSWRNRPHNRNHPAHAAA
ncbi:hypothetical protein XPA_002740 [Xanthoria parietina]